MCGNTFKLCLGSHREMFMKFKNMNNIKSVSESAFYGTENRLVFGCGEHPRGKG